GLRDASSKAEAMGVERARAAMRAADLVLWLQAPDLPAGAAPDLGGADRPSLLTIGTKSDLGAVAGADHAVSAATGAGIAELLHRLHGASGAGATNAADLLVSHERDRVALSAARMALTAAGHLEAPE